MYQAFNPKGATVLVSQAAVQVPCSDNTIPTAYRVRCLVTGYLSWAPPSSATQTAPTLTPAAPTASSPNTLGMNAGQVEIFCLPGSAWFASSNAAGFEMTPGEGV